MDSMNEREEPLGIADQWMMRGEQLRQLKALMEQEENVQEEHEYDFKQNQQSDQVDKLLDGRTVLRYDSYLQHQRYYDDLKHVDCSFIDYGNGLLIEQDKSLGKGGLCWDAAIMLAEHIVDQERDLLRDKRTVELGSGTGMCGLWIANRIEGCHVTMTDLPELLPLLQRNLALNDSTNDPNRTACFTIPPTITGLGTASVNRLSWGCQTDYPSKPYDVILGADVVASLYDPIALAETIWDLSHATSVVFISYKGRLIEPHEQFEQRFRQLFATVERLKPSSRNKNPQVWILKATERQDTK